jgi:hypothetical protein
MLLAEIRQAKKDIVVVLNETVINLNRQQDSMWVLKITAPKYDKHCSWCQQLEMP